MSSGATTAATETPLITFLNQFDEQAWAAALSDLVPAIHEVDKTATQIWFAFYPLSLFKALSESEDPENLARELLLQGSYRLEGQIDSSHQFLYGHRYWPQVKTALERRATEWNGLQAAPSPPCSALSDQIRTLASEVAASLKVDKALLLGITAVAFMTLRQTGLAAFRQSAGQIQLDKKYARRTAKQILKDRAKDDSQGLFGFLKTIDKKWTVVFDENDDSAKYKLNHLQDLAGGAAEDRTRDWVKLDPRRVEGPIPVECRSASCGTCWVGVLGGAKKLAPVAVREGKKIKEFGYIETDEPRPLIRLACQAQAEGAVSIVIPPWNGVFGKYLRKLRASDSINDLETEK